MIQQIHEEVITAIEEVLKKMEKKDYISYILFIGRADIIPGLKMYCGSDYVIDYQSDRYNDETREKFYLRYMNRNYSKEGFNYLGESGIDDLSIEMMIYCHLWDSFYFLKSMYRIAAILDGKGYQWISDIPENGKYKFIKDNIISPLNTNNIKLGNIVEKAYDSNIRNAFAHSLYNVNVDKREIYTRTRQGYKTYTFNDFQERFLYSVFLMNKLQNYLEINHNAACGMNCALTPVFCTPDGLKVQIYGEMINRNGTFYPEFSMKKIKGQDNLENI